MLVVAVDRKLLDRNRLRFGEQLMGAGEEYIYTKSVPSSAIIGCWQYDKPLRFGGRGWYFIKNKAYKDSKTIVTPASEEIATTTIWRLFRPEEWRKLRKQRKFRGKWYDNQAVAMWEGLNKIFGFEVDGTYWEKTGKEYLPLKEKPLYLVEASADVSSVTPKPASWSGVYSFILTVRIDEVTRVRKGTKSIVVKLPASMQHWQDLYRW